MGKKYVGFYWTLPVPWAGFEALPDKVDEAAERSLTIRYQRDLARRWAKGEGGVLICEKAFMEIDPDRGSPEIAQEATKLLLWARERGAVLLRVDFARQGNWRAHAPLRRALQEALARDPASVEEVPLEAIPLEGRPRIFDPEEHFGAWREAWRKRVASRPEHRALILSHLEELPHATLKEQAEALLAAGLATPTGKAWNAGNLRKFLALG
ncbi:hypothetical protein [Neomegalonema sp.]|uniref:hypothetical protein n=1 Tax=Neomegalonema sp. TaxID=2039713 RepID=UPI00263543BF|nr:hypothetical protein [Neomegalonema sp.]MDD2868367.1 hypothetical protein [Neomegalonema sp.]